MSLSLILSITAALGVGGWVGSVISSWLSSQREKAQRRVIFRKEQLEQFYGPLLAMHKEIRARSELRVKIAEAIDTEHTKDMVAAGPGRVEEASDARLPDIITNIRDEAETFREVLMPRYREMIDVFREKMWLAEPETREFFKQLVEYVDVWDKVLGRKLPHSIASAVGHTERNLQPFYQHLEEMHDRLRAEVS
jgi:hypothetical protein